MKILFATFDSPKDFLERLHGGADGVASIRIATRARYDKGETIILEIGFPGLPNRILLRSVAVTPAKGATEQTFRFIRGEEHKRDFLVAVDLDGGGGEWQPRAAALRALRGQAGPREGRVEVQAPPHRHGASDGGEGQGSRGLAPRSPKHRVTRRGRSSRRRSRKTR